jgi:hypothetical protein
VVVVVVVVVVVLLLLLLMLLLLFPRGQTTDECETRGAHEISVEAAACMSLVWGTTWIVSTRPLVVGPDHWQFHLLTSCKLALRWRRWLASMLPTFVMISHHRR